MHDDIPIFPVVGTTIGPIASKEIVIVQFAFLSSSRQKLEEADPGRKYALSPAVALEVRDAIDRALKTLGLSELQVDPTEGS
jgi:hypothetical protein